MTTKDYTPSEIEIRSLGIGLIDSQYLDLDNREYIVVGDTQNIIETGIQVGQHQTTYHEDVNTIHPKNIKYSMIVNNNGIGINTTRNKFDSNYTLNDVSGIYIEKGDIFCDGTISAKNLKIITDDGLPYNLNDVISNPENIINNLIYAINSNLSISKFSQGWISSYIYDQTTFFKNNIYTNDYINIGGSDTDTINNLHPINIISDTSSGTIQNIHLAIKNKSLSQPITYINTAGENVYINEPSSLRIGIIGSDNNSPAIISTTSGMPLEFHVAKSSFDINKLYDISKNIPNYIDNISSNYAAMTITEDGNVCIGKNVTTNIDNRKPKFQVYGEALFDKILINDYKSSTNPDVPNILELDDIYYRKVGNNFSANQIISGDF